ncbi:MAG TPA: hypothetical protein VLF42_02005 [Burkholderiales bacterium]|nr:hypothetical protein [Burkholderiales bacterium]
MEKLARDAGRTPAQTLKFVLRDGFDVCEWEVRESLAADYEVKRKGTIPNEQVQRDAQRIIDGARSLFVTAGQGSRRARQRPLETD